MTNSYMSPHGTRCTASPRVITPAMCRASPAVVRMRAVRTRRPGRPAALAPWPPTARGCRPRRPAGPGNAVRVRTAASAGPLRGPAPGGRRCPAARPGPAADGAPAARPRRTSSGTSAAGVTGRGLRRPKAKSAANAITASEYSTTATIRKWSLRWDRPRLSGISSDFPSVVVGDGIWVVGGGSGLRPGRT